MSQASQNKLPTDQETHAAQAKTQTEQASTRATQAETHAEQASTRTTQAATHSEQARTRTAQTETQSAQDKTRNAQAETQIEQDKTRAAQAEMQTRQANTQIVEQALGVSELSYRRLFEAAQDGILILDVETGRINDVNPFLIKLLGFSRAEILGKTVGELSPFKDVVSNQAMLERLQRDGYVRYEDLPLKTKDGHDIAVEFVSNVYRAGNKKVIQCNIRDITKRKQAEATSALLASIVASSDDAIFGVDLASVFTSWNHGAEKIYGYAASEMIGAPISKIIPADRQAEEKETLERIKAGEKLNHIETMRRTKDGQLIAVSVTASAIKDASGKIIGVSKTARDISEGKRAATALLESKHFLQSTLNALSSHIAILNEHGTIVEVNAAWDRFARENRFLGSGGLGDNYLQVCHSATGHFCEEAPSVASGIRDVMAGKKTEFHLEYPCHGPQERRWFIVRITRFDGDGPVRVVVAHENITERKLAEAALQQSEKKFRDLLENMQLGIVAHAPDTTIQFSNPMASQLLGLTPDQMRGKMAIDPTWCFIQEDGTPLVLDQYPVNRVLPASTKQLPNLILGICRPDRKKPIWVQCNTHPILNPDGQLQQIVVTFFDITSRKLAEDSLRESEEKFRQIAETINEVFWITDATMHRMIYISPAYEKIWGRTCQSLYDSPSTGLDAIHAEDRERVVRAAAVGLAKGEYDEIYRITRPDGSLRWIHDHAVPLRNTAGEISRFIGIAGDITEKRKLEDSFRQAQKMESIGQLAGGIAHDFNNILAAIVGNLYLVRMDAAGQPAILEHLQNISEASQRATDLVKQILTFSRQDKPEREAVKLNHVVQEALKLLRSSMPATIRIQTELVEVPTVLANATAIHQVIMNLGTNAWHAMRDQIGVLKIEMKVLDVDEDFAKTRPDLRPGNYVQLSVSDSGCGMDSATLEHIFEPFFTTKAVGEGTGLGLAVVHGIMKTHDGSISVYSQPGEGTTFHLYFPVIEAEVASGKIEATPIPRGHGEHILFVDDEATLGRLGKKMLERLGYVVTTQTNPLEAITAVRDQPAKFDLVITDLTMPGMDGAKLGAQLLHLQPNLPIIITTGYSGVMTPAKVRELGFRELLSKPSTARTLGETVYRVLQQAASAKK
jgi:PAS domain S-box-containing protein